MRILIYGINYHPELTGIGKYNGEMAVWLAARGHQVRVLTAPPYYPRWRVSSGYRAWAYRRERIDGVVVQRCPLWVPRRPSGAKRVLHLLSFALGSLPAALLWVRWRPQLILVTEPPLFCVPAAWLLARMAGGRLQLHVQDFELDAARELGLLRQGWALRAVAGFERFLMRRCERVSTISGAMRRRLIGKGVARERIVDFPNWIGAEAFARSADRPALRREWRVGQQDFVVLYAGNMGRKQGLEMLLRVARRCERVAGLRFWLCGDGAERPALERAAAGLDQVEFLPLQSESRFRDLLQLVDVHVIPQLPGAADLVMPSKLLGIFASGRPVVVAADVDTELQRVVDGRGLVTQPGDAAAMAAALEGLRGDPARGDELARRAREHARNEWLRDRVLERMEGEWRGMVDH